MTQAVERVGNGQILAEEIALFLGFFCHMTYRMDPHGLPKECVLMVLDGPTYRVKGLAATQLLSPEE